MNSSILNNNQGPSASEIRKTEILTECDHFAVTVSKITADIRTHGYTNRTLPNFPKAALLNMMGETKKPKPVLRGEELDQYLRSKISTLDINLQTYKLLPPEAAPHTSYDDLIDKLYDGYRMLKKLTQKFLSVLWFTGSGFKQHLNTLMIVIIGLIIAVIGKNGSLIIILALKSVTQECCEP